MCEVEGVYVCEDGRNVWEDGTDVLSEAIRYKSCGNLCMDV